VTHVPYEGQGRFRTRSSASIGSQLRSINGFSKMRMTLSGRLVAKPDKSPVRFSAGFHFDDYGVNQPLCLAAILLRYFSMRDL
jgi:hypothetical protein